MNPYDKLTDVQKAFYDGYDKGWVECEKGYNIEKSLKKDDLTSDLRRLRNRLMCYHEGTHGRITVKMHVELKMIDDIKKQIEKLQ